MTGVELRLGGKLLFRGGVVDRGDFCLLYSEDGQIEFDRSVVVGDSGVIKEETGEITDPMEPSASDLLRLASGSELTHKGHGGVLLCVVTLLTMLFADELFRFDLSFRVRDPDRVEPSDWEMAGRHISWTLLPVMALVVFIIGLR